MRYVKAHGDTILAYPYSPTDLIRANPQTSWPAGPLPPETLAAYGVFTVEAATPPTFDPRAHKLIERPPIRVDGAWTQQWTIEPLTPAEAAALNAEQAAAVRADRNARLAACDWTQLLDAPVNAEAWAAYRQALRDVPAQPSFPHRVDWPAAPNQ